MTLFEVLTLVVTLVAATAAVIVNMALLDPEKRIWLRQTTWQLLSTGFYLFMMVGAAAVIWRFAVAPGLPTRSEILVLLLWLFNGIMGIVFWVHDAIERRLTRRAGSRSEQT